MMEISLNYMQKNPNINTASLRSAINSSLRGEKTKTAYNHASAGYRR